jgi:RNA polymerase sigma factor (TIGR02999 family)
MDPDVTQILNAIDQGDASASERLLPLVYDELRALADARLAREHSGQTLQATALVHEAYLRLLGPDHTHAPHWDGRAHFFAAAAEAMRRILVDRARARGAAKRGGSWRRLEVDLSSLTLDDVPAQLVDLDEALTQFKEEEPEKAALVELRFFAGLTNDQAASVLGISSPTATRHWAYARAWLFDRLTQGSG